MDIHKLFKRIFDKFPDVYKEQPIYDDKDPIHIIYNHIKQNPDFIVNLKNLNDIGIKSHYIKKYGGIQKIKQNIIQLINNKKES